MNNTKLESHLLVIQFIGTASEWACAGLLALPILWLIGKSTSHGSQTS